MDQSVMFVDLSQNFSDQNFNIQECTFFESIVHYVFLETNKINKLMINMNKSPPAQTCISFKPVVIYYNSVTTGSFEWECCFAICEVRGFLYIQSDQGHALEEEYIFQEQQTLLFSCKHLFIASQHIQNVVPICIEWFSVSL